MESMDVFNRLKGGTLSRVSAQATKRKHKSVGNKDMELVYKEGISLYDQYTKEYTKCSYYNKSIDDLTLIELVKLHDIDKRLFTALHDIKYSMLMLGVINTKVVNYKGCMVEINEL